MYSLPVVNDDQINSNIYFNRVRFKYACSVLWTFGSGVTQPIFLGGELKAYQDIRQAEQRAAAADYTSAALKAFREVEDALSNEYYLRLREGTLAEMVTNSAAAVKLGGQPDFPSRGGVGRIRRPHFPQDHNPADPGERGQDQPGLLAHPEGIGHDVVVKEPGEF